MTVSYGIAGFSYADWRGVVYPRGCRDPLAFCARYVDCVEINSTFYALPDAGRCASWLRRTENTGVFFTAKLPQRFTHELSTDAADIAATRAGFAPLADAGALRALLWQFSYRFDAQVAHRDHLARLRDAFADVAPPIVEVRHKSWADPAALQHLAELDVSVAHLDYPGASSGFGLWCTGVLGPAQLAYLRLHGRNPAWFQKGAGRDQVYDYDYSGDEVEQLQRRIAAISADARHTIVIGNNHFRGQQLKVVLELMASQCGGPVDVPPLLTETYPSLTGIAKRSNRGLFG